MLFCAEEEENKNTLRSLFILFINKVSVIRHAQTFETFHIWSKWVAQLNAIQANKEIVTFLDHFSTIHLNIENEKGFVCVWILSSPNIYFIQLTERNVCVALPFHVNSNECSNESLEIQTILIRRLCTLYLMYLLNSAKNLSKISPCLCGILINAIHSFSLHQPYFPKILTKNSYNSTFLMISFICF